MGSMTTKYEGDFISFESPSVSNIESLKVHFAPVQSGSGDASPSNVRPISGWDGINLYKSQNSFPILPNKGQQIYYDNNNIYRLAYLGNGKFKLLDTIIGNDIAVFNINLKQFIWPQNINRIVALSTLKQTLNAWDFTFSFRDINNSNIYSGYLNYSAQKYFFSVIIPDSDQTELAGKYTISKLRLVFDKSIPINTEFALFLLNSSNIIDIPLSWQSAAGTLYGGYVDVVSGEVVVDKFCLSFDGTEEGWILQDRGSGYTPYYYIHIPYSAIAHNCICSHMPQYSLSINNANLGSNIATVSGDMGFLIRLDTSVVSRTDLSAFKTWLVQQAANNTPLTAVGELETPITYQLSPTELTTFLHTNNFWSNSNGKI